MRVFITGATGFIGSWVSYRLLAAGHELVALARNPGKLPALWREPKVSLVAGQLTDFDTIARAMVGCDACVHIALGWGDAPTSMLAADTRVTAFLLETAVQTQVERFVYTSSTAALGPFFPDMDESHPLRPDTLYGATKAAAEAYVLAVGATSSMRCNVIRPGYTFGNPVVAGAATQSDARFRTIAAAAREGADIVVRAGDGTQFIAAADLAELYLAVLTSGRNREVYYGLGATFTSWESIARVAVELAGSTSRIVTTGTEEPPHLFTLEKMHAHFGLRFTSTEALRAHVAYALTA